MRPRQSGVGGPSGNWTGISDQFYERASHSKRRAAMLAKGQIAKPEDAMTVEDEVRDPYLSSSSTSRTSTARATLKRP